MLNTTQSRLSKVETGSVALGLDELRFIAAKLNIPPERLGSWLIGPPMRSRCILGDLAAELYPQAHRIPGTTVLTRPEWMPSAPVEIGDIDLYWHSGQPVTSTVTGGIEQTASVRPLAADGTRYGRYSRALRDLARPKLLDNRVSYRLLDVGWTATGGGLGFGYTCYFETLDVCEAVAHEFAEAWLRAGCRRPSLVDLPLRRYIVDPFDLTTRPALPSIGTLTIRRDPIARSAHRGRARLDGEGTGRGGDTHPPHRHLDGLARLDDPIDL